VLLADQAVELRQLRRGVKRKRTGIADRLQLFGLEPRCHRRHSGVPESIDADPRPAATRERLKAPEKMLETDPQAQAMLKEYNNLPMPNQQLSDTEIRQYLRYFHWFDAQPAGPVTSGAAGH
jgi:hypothetical protein